MPFLFRRRRRHPGSTTETVGLLVVFSRLFLYRFNLETWKLDDIVFNLVGDESQLIKKNYQQII